MKTYRLILIAALVTTLFAGVALAGDALHKDMDAGNQAFVKAVLEGDTKAIMSAYTNNACVIAPLAENACGSDAILAFWTAVINSAPKDVKITTGEVGESGDLAYVTGTLVITDATGTEHHNRYVLVFKKVEGAWKLHLDTWTPS
jgi:ketosteroid isomerase-like protein